MKPILEIQHISKKFVINQEEQPYLSIRDSISNIFKSKKATEDFWALSDINFNVSAGDTIGIIGNNGAGKSTLLKVLSKITPPTSGKIISRGRIASLLEVGTGFHPELSGRENVFMNGSILGMRRSEILKNFDAIVEFAGVSKFIDTPLKHYSSGMQLRLAFAVAAFLENEILIIDEVLAVGDAEFQKKCIGKMNDVSKSGRTLLFVSHNLIQLKDICSSAILLEKGKVSFSGATSDAISFYQNKLVPGKIELKSAIRKGPTQNFFRFVGITIDNDDKLFENTIVKLHIEFTTKQSINDLVVGLLFSDISGNKVLEIRSNQNNTKFLVNESGNYCIDLEFLPHLKSNIYMLSVGSRSKEGLLEYLPDFCAIEIKKNINEHDSILDDLSGHFIINSNWKLNK
jgi:lipopolysaccharide transport system ATP-binding protein